MAKNLGPDYFNRHSKDIDICLVPLDFSIQSKRIRRQVVEIVRNSSRVGDLGCNHGTASLLHFNRINPQCALVGIDFAQESIAKAKRLLPLYSNPATVEFRVGNVLEDILPRGEFSFIYCSQVIEHLERTDVNSVVLKHCFDYLKTGGHLFLATVYKKKWARYIYKNQSGENVIAPDHINEYTEVRDLLDPLADAGFEVVDYALNWICHPLVDIPLKELTKRFKGDGVFNFVNSGFVMASRRILTVPIAGFYNFQVLAQKK